MICYGEIKILVIDFVLCRIDVLQMRKDLVLISLVYLLSNTELYDQDIDELFKLLYDSTVYVLPGLYLIFKLLFLQRASLFNSDIIYQTFAYTNSSFLLFVLTYLTSLTISSST